MVLGAFLETVLAGNGHPVPGHAPQSALSGRDLEADGRPGLSPKAPAWRAALASRGREPGACERGRTLLNLDTATDGGASELYESLGWTRAGVIPDYAPSNPRARRRGNGHLLQEDRLRGIRSSLRRRDTTSIPDVCGKRPISYQRRPKLGPLCRLTTAVFGRL